MKFSNRTAAEITPVVSMDSKKIGTGKPGDVTKKMMLRIFRHSNE